MVRCTEVHSASFLSGGFTTMAVINPLERKLAKRSSMHCTEVRFASFLSGGFTTMAVINPPERKLAKPISVYAQIRKETLESVDVEYTYSARPLLPPLLSVEFAFFVA